MLYCSHLGSGFCTERCHHLAPGIPACAEGGERCVVPCGLVGDPPCFQLLIPSLCVCCSADADVRLPDRRMSICSHDHLLGFVRAPTLCRMAVRSTNRLMTTIGYY